MVQLSWFQIILNSITNIDDWFVDQYGIFILVSIALNVSQFWLPKNLINTKPLQITSWNQSHISCFPVAYTNNHLLLLFPWCKAIPHTPPQTSPNWLDMAAPIISALSSCLVFCVNAILCNCCCNAAVAADHPHCAASF